MAISLDDQRAASLLARIERTQISPWHIRALLVMGSATFFDAFDVLAIAYVLPALIGVWKLAPRTIGVLISSSFIGQIAGALFTGAASGAIKNITQLGIGLNNDGTLTLNADTLNSALNSNFSDVTGFLQNSGGFGQTLASSLNNLGTQAPNGAVYLAQQQNSAQEKALSTSISNEDTLLAAQKIQLTNELNTANQILQSIPSQLNQVNEIYSAITGYNQNRTG